MKIVAVADTHGHQPKLPSGDVLIHAGDGTMRGHESEAKKLDDWFGSLGFKHILYVPGNHDFIFERRLPTSILGNAIVLVNEGIEIDGVKFWGSPYSVSFGNWAFMKPENELKLIWNKIPEDTDVLITHGPPSGILDYAVRGVNAGSLSLIDKVGDVKPKFHIYGHIHEAAGVMKINGTTFVNASIVDVHYKEVNKPFEGVIV